MNEPKKPDAEEPEKPQAEDELDDADLDAVAGGLKHTLPTKPETDPACVTKL